MVLAKSKLIWGALFGALLISTPVYAFKLDDTNYNKLKIEDQRAATIMQKIEWMMLAPAIAKKRKKISLHCVFKKTIPLKVIFFDKKKNYVIHIKCGANNGR